ncbi:hypothetical protein RRSWK_02620 [Rhodopirellula sp. SWK7]|nr:hypothetical protein RRSWK_02620 [Rhodopirellula sp. SWK7]
MHGHHPVFELLLRFLQKITSAVGTLQGDPEVEMASLSSQKVSPV